ncbi:hypothetical protein QJS66_00135 [Kocuria rhizophila]|nr:hypothetical protein QJS66_00135 [Kocuria rhizophila]
MEAREALRRKLVPRSPGRRPQRDPRGQGGGGRGRVHALAGDLLVSGHREQSGLKTESSPRPPPSWAAPRTSSSP